MDPLCTSDAHVSFCWLSSLVTVAWFTTLSIRHLPGRGQDSFWLQLHSFFGFSVRLVCFVEDGFGHAAVA